MLLINISSQWVQFFRFYLVRGPIQVLLTATCSLLRYFQVMFSFSSNVRHAFWSFSLFFNCITHSLKLHVKSAGYSHINPTESSYFLVGAFNKKNARLLQRLLFFLAWTTICLCCPSTKIFKVPVNFWTVITSHKHEINVFTYEKLLQRLIPKMFEIGVSSNSIYRN